jgi:hypothetical protein
MPDGSRNAHVPLSAEALDEAEYRALAAAVAEALADPRPDIPHEEVRAEILAEIEELERQIAASSAA